MDENNNNKVPPTAFMGSPVPMQQQPMYSFPPQQQQQPYPPQQPDPYAQPMVSPYPPQQPQQQLPYPPQPYPDPYAAQPGAPYPPQAFIQPSSYPPQPDVYGQYPQASYDLGGPHEKHHHYSKEETMHAILCRDYHVTISEWVSQAWGIYKSCWWGYSVTFLLYVLLSMIPYIGFAVMLLGYVLYAGWFISATNSMKSGQPVRAADFVHGFGFGLWIFGQSILITLAVALGLVLFIVPGLILSVILSFSWFVLIEYKRNGIELIDAMILSAKVCWKKFWWILLFNIAMFFLAISGVLALGVGLLVTVPLAYIAHATAFRDIFGLNMNSEEANWQQV